MLRAAQAAFSLTTSVQLPLKAWKKADVSFNSSKSMIESGMKSLFKTALKMSSVMLPAPRR